MTNMQVEGNMRYVNTGFGETALTSYKAMAPGSDCDTIYYDDANSTKNICDLQGNNQFQQAFTTLSLPGSAMVQVPNIDVLDYMQIHLRLPRLITQVAAAGNSLVLPRGWGYALIDRIDYRVGASTTYTITGDSHLIDIMSQAESEGKQNELLNDGGYLTSVINSGNATQSQTDNQRLNEAYCLIATPFTRVRALHGHKPLDTGMLSSPIQITVYFKSLSQVLGGSDASAFILANNNGQLQLGEFLARQIRFVFADESKAMQIRSNPSAHYIHNIIFEQPGNTIQYSLAQSPDFSNPSGAQPVQLTLTGFRQGTLLSITVYCISLKQLNGTGTQTYKNPFDYLEMRDIQLLYNGQVIIRAPGDSAKVNGCLQDIKAPYFPNVRTTPYVGPPNPPVNNSPVFSGVNTYFYELNVSQFSSHWTDAEHLQSGIQIGQNTVNIQFTNPVNPLYGLGNGDPCLFRCTYNYDGGIDITGGGTRSDFIF